MEYLHFSHLFGDVAEFAGDLIKFKVEPHIYY